MVEMENGIQYIQYIELYGADGGNIFYFNLNEFMWFYKKKFADKTDKSIKKNCNKILKKYKGYIVRDFLILDKELELPAQLKLYFKLRDRRIKMFENKKGSYITINGRRIFSCLYDNTITLQDYKMVMNIIYKWNVKITDIYEAIIFDDMIQCKKFVEYIANEFNLDIYSFLINEKGWGYY